MILSPYVVSDVSAAILGVALIAVAPRLIAKDRTPDVKWPMRPYRTICAFALTAVAWGILPRLFHSEHAAGLANLFLGIEFFWRSYEDGAVHRQWIATEIAAGRLPKEARVYNEWARPDPE